MSLLEPLDLTKELKGHEENCLFSEVAQYNGRAMCQPPDSDRLHAAYEKVRRTLLDRRTPEGHWVGRLSNSALSTATTISAFSVFRNSLRDTAKHDFTAEELQLLDASIEQCAGWLMANQNPDGGWGDTDKSFSNISTTLLVKSALLLSSPLLGERVRVRGDGGEEWHNPHPNPLPDGEGAINKADEYLQKTGGFAAIKKRYGKDHTFSVPILTNAALAGLVDWKDIPKLPWKLAVLPMSWFRFVQMNVVSYAIPALVAVGQVQAHFKRHSRAGGHDGGFFHRWAKKRTLKLIQAMQPESGGYLEAAPLTGFVVMSLAAMGLTNHPIVTKGIRFLLKSIREDGGVPIDTNLATWVTTLSVNALGRESFTAEESARLVDWILSCQHMQRHPFTSASPGGWGWTDLSGAVPDGDDTPGAILALFELLPNIHEPERKKTLLQAFLAGAGWLCDLQNSDGGMPTFCRGWGTLPFDKSSTDLTAHAMQHLEATSQKRAIRFLERSQQNNGSWLPLWFGNQHQPDDVNPFYGTARVLMALMKGWTTYYVKPTMVHRGYDFLIVHQNPDGSWGNSVEETAVVVEALVAFMGRFASFNDQFGNFGDQAAIASAYHRGLNWLVEAVESDRFLEASPIGLYFAKLWYYEVLYPIIFTAAALRRALRIFHGSTIEPC